LRDISDYVDDELDPKQRTALEEHFAECRHCAAVLEGTCNVIRLYRDERALALPKGFHDRLHKRLDQTFTLGPKERIHTSRRAVLAWALTAAAAVPLGFALFSAKRIILPRLGHKSPSGPPDSPPITGLVAVSRIPMTKSSTFLAARICMASPNFFPAAEAVREGYAPCPICIGKHKPEKKG